VAGADLESRVSSIARDKAEAALAMDDLLRDAANNPVFFPKRGKPG